MQIVHESLLYCPKGWTVSKCLNHRELHGVCDSKLTKIGLGPRGLDFEEIANAFFTDFRTKERGGCLIQHVALLFRNVNRLHG
jgi:hypothetical protein